MNTISKIMMAAGCGVMILGSGAMASPVIGGITLDGFGSDSLPGGPHTPFAWSVGAGSDGVQPPSIDVGNSTLDILVNNATLVPGPGYGYVVTTDGHFTGDYSTLGPQAIVSFDLTTTAGSDLSGLALYFHSTAIGGGNDWTFAFTPVTGTYTYRTVIGSSATGWNDWSGVGSYASALVDIDRIGLYLENSSLSPSGFSYTLDNFEINAVPEPETVWMMIAVLASLAVTFRGRIKDVLSTIKI